MKLFETTARVDGPDRLVLDTLLSELPKGRVEVIATSPTSVGSQCESKLLSTLSGCLTNRTLCQAKSNSQNRGVVRWRSFKRWPMWETFPKGKGVRFV